MEIKQDRPINREPNRPTTSDTQRRPLPTPPMEFCFNGNQRAPGSPLEILIQQMLEDPERWDGLS